jgi:hypothetical protein
MVPSNLTNSIELSLSWETNIRSAAQEFRNILCNPNVHCPIHKSLPLVPVVNQINSVHTTPSYYSRILILSSDLH